MRRISLDGGLFTFGFGRSTGGVADGSLSFGSRVDSDAIALLTLRCFPTFGLRIGECYAVPVEFAAEF